VKTILFIITVSVFQIQALESVQESGTLSGYVDRQCHSPLADASPQTRLSCAWNQDVNILRAYEKGRSPREVHTGWIRSLRERLMNPTAAAIALDYFEYLEAHQRVQVDGLYLLYKFRHTWKSERSDRYQVEVLERLVSALPGGSLTHSLYLYRLARNLREVWGWDVAPQAEAAARQTLIEWLENGRNLQQLTIKLNAGGTESTLGLLAAFVASMLVEPVKGFMGTSPLEFLYRDVESNRKNFFYGVYDGDLANQWWAIRMAGLDPRFVETFAGRFLVKLPIEKLSRLENCDWLGVAMTESGNHRLPLDPLMADCRYLAVDSGRGVGFWASVGLGFEKPTPSLARLNAPVRERPVTAEAAQHWKVLQISLWLLAGERVAIGDRGTDMDREFEVDSAAKLFINFREGQETPLEYLNRNIAPERNSE
jgi:hypothetical protein